MVLSPTPASVTYKRELAKINRPDGGVWCSSPDLPLPLQLQQSNRETTRLAQQQLRPAFMSTTSWDARSTFLCKLIQQHGHKIKRSVIFYSNSNKYMDLCRNFLSTASNNSHLQINKVSFYSIYSIFSL